jgi:hypothetical protein
MAQSKKLERHYTIIDIIAHLLASDPYVQKYLSYYHANQHRIVDAVLNEILQDIESIVASPNPNATTKEL